METILASLSSSTSLLHGPALLALLDISRRTDISTLTLLMTHLDRLSAIHQSNATLSVCDKKVLSDVLSSIYVLDDYMKSFLYRMDGSLIRISFFGYQYVKKFLGIILDLRKGVSRIYVNKDVRVCIEKRLSSVDGACVDGTCVDGTCVDGTCVLTMNVLHYNVYMGCSYLFKSNCECDGVDFLIEYDLYDLIPHFVDDDNVERILVYLDELCFYYRQLENVIMNIHRQREDYVSFILSMIRFMDDRPIVRVPIEKHNMDQHNMEYLFGVCELEDPILDPKNKEKEKMYDNESIIEYMIDKDDNVYSITDNISKNINSKLNKDNKITSTNYNTRNNEKELLRDNIECTTNKDNKITSTNYNTRNNEKELLRDNIECTTNKDDKITSTNYNTRNNIKEPLNDSISKNKDGKLNKDDKVTSMNDNTRNNEKEPLNESISKNKDDKVTSMNDNTRNNEKEPLNGSISKNMDGRISNNEKQPFKISMFIYDNNILRSISYVLNKVDYNSFLQILFILNRCNIKPEINSTIQIAEKRFGRTNEVSIILSESYLPSINYYLHKDLEITEPLRLEKYIHGVTNVDKDITLKNFCIYSISNMFVHYGFGRDSLIMGEHDYNIDSDTIFGSEKMEIIGALGSLGGIKNNSPYHVQPDKKTENNVITASKKKTMHNIGKPLQVCSEYNIPEKGIYFNDMVESFVFLESPSYKKSGALLAHAISNQTPDNEHSSFALLSENLTSKCKYMKISSLIGIYIIYSNKSKVLNIDFIKESLLPYLHSEDIEVVGITSYVLGSIFQGSNDSTLINYFMMIYMQRHPDNNSSIFFTLIVIGAALLTTESTAREIDFYSKWFRGYESIFKGLAFIGKSRADIVEDLFEEYINLETNSDNSNSYGEEGRKSLTRDIFDSINEIKNMGFMSDDDTSTESSCNGNCKKNNSVSSTKSVSSAKSIASVKKPIIKKNKKPISLTGCDNTIHDLTTSKDTSKSMILFSITLISMNDPHTKSIMKKLLINNITKDKTDTIPLCLGLLCASTPDNEVIECLSKSLNNTDPSTSIIGLGLIAAGTNNKKIQAILESQHSYHQKTNRITNLLKISQGLLAMGKGTLTLSPHILNKNTICKKSLSALLLISILAIGDEDPLSNKFAFLWYGLVPAIRNKYVVAVDENLNCVETEIRVGRPVQNAGMAGKAPTLSAVVTHESPVIVQDDERAEILSDAWNLQGLVEDIIVLRK